MAVVSAGLYKVGNSKLRKRRRTDGVDEFESSHRIEVTSWMNPANSKTGRQGFGERGAQNNKVFRIEGLGCLWTNAIQREIAVNIVLDEWDVVFRDETHKIFLVRIIENEAKRIVAIRDADARSNLMLLDRALQLVQIHTFPRMRRDFDRLHSQRLDDLKDGEIRRAFYRNHIART